MGSHYCKVPTPQNINKVAANKMPEMKTGSLAVTLYDRL